MTVRNSRRPVNSTDNEIRGKGRVNQWPTVIHLCPQRSVRISDEVLVNGIEIGNVRYRIKGLVFHGDDREWSVSVERPHHGGWHHLTRDSVPQQQMDRAALLSDVVLIQLSKENQGASTNAAGLSSIKIWVQI